MGSVNFGPPKDLILHLAEQGGVKFFVEGGTYHGGTAAWAADHFERVWTIEGHPEMFKKGVHLDARPNVVRLLGDTREMLPEALGALDGPALFWLDAHWCGESTFGAGAECPLLEELSMIRRFIAETGHNSSVLVDDARLFLAPPPHPHSADDWPPIDDLLEAAAKLSPDEKRYQVVTDDVIFSVPAAAGGGLKRFLQDRLTSQLADRSAPAETPPPQAERAIRRVGSVAKRLIRKAC